MIGRLIQLAVQDLLHDRRLFFCFTAALVAVLAPLLIVFGLKFGVMDGALERLKEDPRNREVVGIGNRRFDAAWFREIERRSDVAFVIPRTRSIAAQVFLSRHSDRATGIPVELIPSDRNDPLIGSAGLALSDTSVVISQSVATRLGLVVGDTVNSWVIRVKDGQRQRAETGLSVGAIVPSSVHQRDVVFTELNLLLGYEDFLDGRIADLTPILSERSFAGYRLFARSIADVGTLERDLVAQGLDVRTRAAEIEMTLMLDHNLSLLFAVIAGLAVSGFVLSFSASLWANVERRHRELSVLRLIGVPAISLSAFPLAQSLLIALTGLVTSVALFFAGSEIANRVVAGAYGDGTPVCHLLPQHFLVTAAGTMLVGGVAPLLAILHVVRIEPTEGLRDV